MENDILAAVIEYCSKQSQNKLDLALQDYLSNNPSPEMKKFQVLLETVSSMDMLYLNEKLNPQHLEILKIVLMENNNLERMIIDGSFNSFKFIEYIFRNCKMLSVFDIINLSGPPTFGICGINWGLGTMVKLEIHACELHQIYNGVTAFHVLCNGLKGNEYISELCITHCFLSDVHCDDMVTLLSTTKSVSALVIYGNNFQAESVKAICSAIAKSNTIRKLDLSQKQMDSQSLAYLFEFVVEYQNLEGLALFEVNIEDEAMTLLTAMLKKSNLTSLNCLGSKTTIQGFKSLTEAIAHHEYLEEVDLTDIDTGDDYLQCKYVGEMIKTNRTIYKLVFENFDTLYIDEIINGLKENYYLTGLNQEDEDNEDLHLIQYTDRNKIIQNRAALDFISAARALIITTIPNDLKLFICRYLAVACMIPKSSQKLLVATFLDIGSIGGLVNDDVFSRAVLIDACTKYQNVRKL
ncbi:hypothetical protein HDV06_004744 [Boothiomyces sp. JEL0866]|nr:hypothetical protein HDV06_004744 [Boothiomyces sp. JEL0866]